mgnify:CR=1 FL=1
MVCLEIRRDRLAKSQLEILHQLRILDSARSIDNHSCFC